MYVLHYAPDNASLIVRLALEELGVPYRTTLVNRAREQQRSPTYRALNPAGLIPALETPHGVIFETGAILLWLADTHGRMAPRPDDTDRGEMLKWLFFVSNTLHTQLRMTFYPDAFAGPDPQAQTSLRAHLQSVHPRDMTLPKALALLEDRYAARPLHAGEHMEPQVLDYYVATLLRWCALYPAGATAWFDVQAYPALMTLAARLEERPATHAAQAAEGLGATPFTAPHYATPPEGSAT